eukprot:scaffold7125_cov54-Phaeocystis_antarctica.AAC.6
MSLTTDRVDLAASRCSCKTRACFCHVGQRLPTVGLGVVNVRRAEITIVSVSAHGIELAVERRHGHWCASAVTTIGRQACYLLPGIGQRFVHVHRAWARMVSVEMVPAQNINQARKHNGNALLGAERRPRPNGRLHKARVHRRKAHVLHRREQLGHRLLASVPPPHHPLEDGFLALSHQPVLLHQLQHLRAGRRLWRQLLEAAKGRRDRGLLERGQCVEISEPPHVEGVARCELRLDREGARRLERVDHQPRRRVEHLGQQASLDLARALVDESQHRLKHRRAEPLNRVGGARCVAHARIEETEKIP